VPHGGRRSGRPDDTPDAACTKHFPDPPFFDAQKAGVHCDTALGKSSHCNGCGAPGAKAESALAGNGGSLIKQERPADEAPRNMSNQRYRRPF